MPVPQKPYLAGDEHCRSQLSEPTGKQPPAPTRQPRVSGVLRKERISQDFNAGLGCPKSSPLLPPAQAGKASRRSPVWVTAWGCPSGWPRPLLDLPHWHFQAFPLPTKILGMLNPAAAIPAAIPCPSAPEDGATRG